MNVEYYFFSWKMVLRSITNRVKGTKNGEPPILMDIYQYMSKRKKTRTPVSQSKTPQRLFFSQKNSVFSTTSAFLLFFHFLTSKVNHDDRNGHITNDLFHCDVIISSLAKVTGLQTRVYVWRKRRSKNAKTQRT